MNKIVRNSMAVIALVFALMIAVVPTFAASSWLSSVGVASSNIVSPSNALGVNNGTYAIFPSTGSPAAEFRWSGVQPAGNVLVYMKAPTSQCNFNIGFYNGSTSVAVRQVQVAAGTTGVATLSVPASFEHVLTAINSGSGPCWLDAVGR